MFREVNERVRAINESLELAEREGQFLCECARGDCTKQVTVSLDDYEEIRRVPTHFLVAGMNHVDPEIERIFAKREGYFVVEKFGKAGAAAIELDPR